jgi:hypothetical protein
MTKTHVGVAREWTVSLGILTAISISREEANMKLAAFLPMLMSDFEDGAFTKESLNHVAKACVKGFPTYPELHNHLRDWWREHRPMPPLLAKPKEAPPLEPRVPPTDEEVAHVRRCVEQIIANMRDPFGQRSGSPMAPRPAYMTPAQLDQINPLPNGRKRVPVLAK